MGVVEKLEDRKYTLDEYLALEELAEYKSEFWDGTIVAMAGGKPSNNKIANSTGRAIENELDKKNIDCSTYKYLPPNNRHFMMGS